MADIYIKGDVPTCSTAHTVYSNLISSENKSDTLLGCPNEPHRYGYKNIYIPVTAEFVPATASLQGKPRRTSVGAVGNPILVLTAFLHTENNLHGNSY
jgi:hypothetical protein